MNKNPSPTNTLQYFSRAHCKKVFGPQVLLLAKMRTSEAHKVHRKTGQQSKRAEEEVKGWGGEAEEEEEEKGVQ